MHTKANIVSFDSNYFFILLKGLIIGSTMLVPGVSGGSMAMILGIYDRLISSVSSFSKNIKRNIFFLSIFALGSIAGILIFARPISSLIDYYPKPTLYFFIGAVMGGIPLIVGKAKIERLSLKTAICILIGLSIFFSIDSIPTGIFYYQGSSSIKSFLILLFVGIITAIALILPGISVSYMLLIMGVYKPTIEAIISLQFSFLIPLGIGILFGIILTTKILEYAMKKYTTTYLIIFGFILGSLYEIFPGIPLESELIVCIISLISGYSLINLLSKMDSSN